jgi:beta-lactamase superfamily II metal-dependent hydrolase
MHRVAVWAGAGLFAVTMAATLVAQAPALDVKMGLWEVSATTEIGGQMPTYDTSKMTAEQKARIDAAMKEMQGTHTNVNKSCMTREKFEKQSFMMTGNEKDNCKQTITTNTRSALEATVVCTGEHPMKGQMHIDALSPTSVKGTVKSATTDQGRTMTVNAVLIGKWLGADCGNEK